MSDDIVMGEYVRVFVGQDDLGYGIYFGEVPAPEQIRRKLAKELSSEELARLTVPKIYLEAKMAYIYPYGERYWLEPLGDRNTTVH